MAQRCLPTLTHQKRNKEEELETLQEEAVDVLQPLLRKADADNIISVRHQYHDIIPEEDQLHSASIIRSELELQSKPCVRTNDINSNSTSCPPPVVLSIDTSGSSSNMESCSEPLLLVNSCEGSCTYSNGGIQMNILVGNDDTIDGSDKLIQASLLSDSNSVGSPAHPSTASTSSLGSNSATNERRSATLNSATTCTSGGLTAFYLTNSPNNILVTSAHALRNRHRFAHARSVSTDVPLASRRERADTVEGSCLSKLGSLSGPLFRANSFERGTQTTTFNRLNSDSRSNVCHESAISDIGVEYMRATGFIATKFKQLQKPNLPSQDSFVGSSKRVNYDSVADGNRKDKHSVSHLCSEVPTVVHMSDKTNSNNQPSHVIKVDTTDDEPTVPQHHHIGYRLGQRKLLAERRRKIADLCCLFALLGLFLMIIETECSIASIYSKYDAPSYVIKSLISITTIILLVLICFYHAVEVKLFVVDNCIEDWRIAMSWPRVLQITAELIFCAVHPVPIPYHFRWTIYDIKSLEYRSAQVPLDVAFSLPMFIRLYLIIRVMLLHSKLFTDASSRSIGALNKITFNTRFVLKTLMTIFPGTVMGVFMLTLWLICAWTFRACESYHDPLFANFLNTLYMVAITFLSVGYGDFVPHTYCGRAISVISGLVGAGCTALVVAVIARKLELTRAEKHVHNFMLESQLSKKLKDAAANVLRETWLIYKYTKVSKTRVNGRKIRAHQRKFLYAIQTLRLVKLKQRKLADQANSLTDFAKTTSQVHDIVGDLRGAQESCNARVANIEQTLHNLQHQVEALPQAIAQIMLEKQLSTSSFVSANDISLHNSPHAQRRRAGAATSGFRAAQTSFDSY